MFAADPMRRVRLVGLAAELPDAALALARFGAFDPAPNEAPEFRTAPNEAPEFDPASDNAPEPDARGAAYREAWSEAHARLEKLQAHCGAAAPPLTPDHTDARAPTLADLGALNVVLRDAWRDCLDLQGRAATLAEARARLGALDDAMARLTRLDVELAPLLRADSLLAFDLGSVPARAVHRLRDALAITGHLFTRVDEVGDQVFAVVAGPRTRHDEVRGLLAQAGWHALDVPDAFRTRPDAARAWLDAERARLDADLAAVEAESDALRARFAPTLIDAGVVLALARPLAEAARIGVVGRGELAALSGWVPARRLPELAEQLAERFHGRVWLAARAPRADEAAATPSALRYPAWLAPFARLAGQYGLPRYGEFDPALPFAFTWLLLFGAMFGDVGHGAAIAVLAVLFRRKLGFLAWPGVAAGVSSMGFGVAYGSVFGVEGWIEPRWLSPLADPQRALALAVGFGVGFVAFTQLIGAGNRWFAGRRVAALFDPGGLAGLAFYLGAAGALVGLAGGPAGSDSGWSGAPWLAGAGFVAFAARLAWSAPGRGMERALVAFIETFETVVGLFSNTLSFLRVAAFSLNHVALALAVFALAHGLSTLGHGVALALGNVVIVGLEGGIVAIQALRLLYYEGFSRFYSGDGRAFAPLKLG